MNGAAILLLSRTLGSNYLHGLLTVSKYFIIIITSSIFSAFSGVVELKPILLILTVSISTMWPKGENKSVGPKKSRIPPLFRNKRDGKLGGKRQNIISKFTDSTVRITF